MPEFDFSTLLKGKKEPIEEGRKPRRERIEPKPTEERKLLAEIKQLLLSRQDQSLEDLREDIRQLKDSLLSPSAYDPNRVLNEENLIRTFVRLEKVKLGDLKNFFYLYPKNEIQKEWDKLKSFKGLFHHNRDYWWTLNLNELKRLIEEGKLDPKYKQTFRDLF